MRRLEADRSHWRAFRWAYALWLFGVFAYFVPAATWSPVSRFDLTRSIVEDFSLQIDSSVENTGDRAFRDGHWYSDKAPIPSLLAVPSYAAFYAFQIERGRKPEFISVSTADTPALHLAVNGTFSRGVYFCSITTVAIAGVAIALLSFEWLRRKVSAGAALFGSLTIALATPIFPYATSFYGHVLAGAFLMLAFTRLAPSSDEKANARSQRIAGAALVLAVGCEYLVAIPVAVILGWALYRSRREGRWRSLALDLALGSAVPIAIIATYQTLCFGSPFRTGYSFLPGATFAAGHASGFMGIHLPRPTALAGLLIGGRRGLFFLAPITLFASIAIGVRVARSKQSDERLAVALMIVLLLLNAGYYMWWGGAASGPRHLVPVLSFLSLGLAFAWERPSLRPWLVVIALISFANMLALTAVGLEAPEQGNALFDYAWPRLLARKLAHLTGASNLGLQLGFSRVTSLLPLLVWLSLGLRHLVRRLSPTSTAIATATAPAPSK